MEIIVDVDHGTPLFTQVIDQIKQAVLVGKLAPGDPLPSIRQLANDLDVNSKTVAKAYRLLERDSVIRTRGYRGTSIHPDARANARTDMGSRAESTLARAVRELRAAGATDSEIRIAFGDVMKSPAPQETNR